MKNNFKIMKTKADLNEPLKNLGSFSNPKIWAQEMGFYDPAWVVSFFAQSCEVPASKGSDPSVHLNIHFKSHNNEYMSVGGSNSNDTSDNPESTTFAFRNQELIQPKRVTHEPSAMISLNNAMRNKNESFEYDSEEELEASQVKRRRSGPGFSDRARSTICPSEAGSVSSARSVSMRSVCSSAAVRTTYSRSQSLSGFTSWQKNFNEKGQYDEVETLYRLEAKRKTYPSLEERPPFYPPNAKGIIPALYGVHSPLRKSSSNNNSNSNSTSMTPSKTCSTDSPQLKRLNSECSATLERGNVRGNSCRSIPLLSYDELEFDDQTADGMSVNVDEEEEKEEALRQVRVRIISIV